MLNVSFKRNLAKFYTLIEMILKILVSNLES